MEKFNCSQCGLCCQRVNFAEETKFLDRGDGTCKHYDSETKNCSIYTTRPDICRVDKFYERHYKKTHSWDEYVVMNLAACRDLQEHQNQLINSIIEKS